MGGRFNCSPLYLSSYGSILGVPVALFGVLWFGLVALIAWFSTPSRDRNSLAPGGTYLFAISTIGLAVVMYLGYTSWTVFKTFCVLCLGTYAAVTGIFVTTGVSSPMSVSQLFGRFSSDLGAAFRRPLVLVLTLALLGGTGYAASVFPHEGAQIPGSQENLEISPEQAKAFAEAWAQQPREDIGVPADGAKVLIVKFNDYQCPGCAATHAWYKPVLAKYEKSNPGAVKYVLKDWPWNAKCNANLTPGAPGVPEHPGTCEAAAMVRMARALGGHTKEVEVQDWLFANMATVNPAIVKAAAERMLGVKDFDAEYAKQLPEIRKDATLGGVLHVESTPTLFINGVRIAAPAMPPMPAAYLDLAIQLELKRSGK